MPEPTQEQKAAFERYQQEHANDPVSTPEVIKGVIDDDVREADANLEKRQGHSREYNAKYIPPVVEPGKKKEIKEKG